MPLSHSHILNQHKVRPVVIAADHPSPHTNNSTSAFNEQTLFLDQPSTAKNPHGDLTTAATVTIMTRPLTLNEELLYRQLHGNRGVGAINKLYGAERWVKDLDIIGELRGHEGCINALQ